MKELIFKKLNFKKHIRFKKITAAIISVCILFAMIPGGILEGILEETSGVTEVYGMPVDNKAALTMNGVTAYYTSFAAAVSNASGDATISLLADDTYEPAMIQIGDYSSLKSLTLTSNGKAKLTCTENQSELFMINTNGSLCINGADLTIEASTYMFDLRGGTFNMMAGTAYNPASSTFPIMLLSGDVNMSGGTLRGKYRVIDTCTSDATGTLRLGGGSLISDEGTNSIGFAYGDFKIYLFGDKNLSLTGVNGSTGSIIVNSKTKIYGSYDGSFFKGNAVLLNYGIPSCGTNLLELGDIAVNDASPEASFSSTSFSQPYSYYGLEYLNNNSFIVAKGTQNTPNGLSDGNLKINGTTSSMEYASSPDANSWTNCGSSYTSVPAGKWYIRYKETTNMKASQPASVTVTEKYMVSFVNGENGVAPKNQIIEKGMKVIQPTDLTADGYLFAGWYSDSQFTTPWDFQNDTVSGNTLIYAKWKTKIGKPDLKVNTFFYTGSNHTLEINGFLPDKMNISGDSGINAATYDVVISLKDKIFTCWDDGTSGDIHFGWTINKFATDEVATADIADGEITDNNTPVTLKAPAGFMIALLPDGNWVDSLTTTELNAGTNIFTYYLKRISDGAIDLNTKSYTVKLRGTTETKTETDAAPSEVKVADLDKIYDTVVTDSTKGFTAEDKAVVDKGGTVNIKAKASQPDLTKVQDHADKIKETAALSGNAVGVYIDLSIDKIVKTVSGDETVTSLKELPYLVTFYIDIANDMRGKDQYFIYRFHENAIDTITSKANSDGEVVTLSPDGTQLILKLKKFSTYAVAYADTKSTDTVAQDSTNATSQIIQPASDAASDVIVKTADMLDYRFWIGLAFTSAMIMTFVYLQKKKKSTNA